MNSVGIDTGGTFTDVILVDDDGSFRVAKVPSTPDHPEQAVIDGLDALGVDAAGIGRFVHGTTVNTNAMLTGAGARTGLITTLGFRDVLEVRRAHRRADYLNIYNLQQELPKPLVPRRHRAEVAERVLYDGSVLEPLDEDGVRAIAGEFKSAGIEAVAIVFIFSYNHPDHERRAKEIVQQVLPDAFVTTSVETDAVFREYERTSTTVVNAYLGPRSKDYFSELGETLKGRGVPAEILLMGSNGGTVTLRSAIEKPVTTVLSGLAGGAIGGAFLAGQSGRGDLITLDIGGTSCDVCLIRDGVPAVTTEGEVADHALTIPVIDVHTIGAGGGSIAWIDSGGALRVGPQSAGADPGPACYGHGGELPTVTDAHLVLGYLNADNFLGGRLKLDVGKARAAIETHVAKPYGFDSLEEAAYAIHQIVNANMASALRVVSVDKGYDPREFTLAVFGGAGPIHGMPLADALNIPAVLVPPYPGIHSAVGLIAADNQQDFRRSYLSPIDGADKAYVAGIYEQLEAEGRALLARDGIAETDQEIQRFAELRYIGQAHEVNVAVPAGGVTDEILADLKTRFHAEHERLFSHSSPDAPTMFVTLAVRAIGRRPSPGFPRIARGGGAVSPVAERPVYFGDSREFADARIFDRAALKAGDEIEGPAVIEQMDSTTVVLPGHRVQVDEIGSLVISRI